MPLDIPDAEAPVEVDLDRANGLTLRWADGTESFFELEELRRNCPCAECRGLREQGIVPGPHPRSLLKLSAVGAELVGGWGLSIQWSDGHSTGIYAWSLLRAWREPGEPGLEPE